MGKGVVPVTFSSSEALLSAGSCDQGLLLLSGVVLLFLEMVDAGAAREHFPCRLFLRSRCVSIV